MVSGMMKIFGFLIHFEFIFVYVLQSVLISFFYM